jgi:hypothetical protein
VIIKKKDEGKQELLKRWRGLYADVGIEKSARKK